MKRFYLVCLYASAFLSLAVQCDEDPPIGPDDELYFLEEVSISPFKKEYSIGDTIWVETLIPDKSLFDAKTEQEYLVDTMSIPLSIYFFSRHPRPGFGVPADENDFRVINQQNLDVKKNQGAVFTYYGCNKPDFKIKLGFILGNKGVFTIGLNDAVLRLCNGSFPVDSNPMIGYRFDVVDGNKDLYLAIPETSKHINDNLEIQRAIDAKTMVAISVK